MRSLLILCSYLLISSSLFGQEAPETTQSFVNKFTGKKHKAASKMLTQDMQNLVSTRQMKMLWTGVQTQFGKYEKVVYLSTREKEDNRVSEYDLVFEKARFVLEVAENQDKRIAGFYLKPSGYKLPPYATGARFGKENIKIKSGEFVLPGEILLPLNRKNPPLAILVHGSGPNDRDESIGPTKVFYDLALGLAAEGIATLRYEKRTKVYDSLYKSAQFGLWEETIEDAIQAVHLAKQSTLIDTANIFIIGHSLGAMVAPYIGNYSPATGVVMLAGPCRSLADLIADQSAYMMALDGKMNKKDKKSLKAIENRRDKIKRGEFSESDPNADLLGYWPGKYWKSESIYMPLPQIDSLAKPLLILQGGRDYQVDPVKDFNPLKEKCSTKAHCKSALFESLNHLFISGTGAPNPSEYFKQGNVEESVILHIADWINSNTKR
jgi:hypothetical protein